MKGGRKNLKRAGKEKTAILQQGQSIMQVVDLRGSNIIEVLDANGEKSLAIFPAKFQKSMWIKRGNFVVVDESGREEAIESGRKVGCIVTQVLFYDQVREYQKSPEWPEIFKSAVVETSKENLERHTSQTQDIEDSSDDDGLPPLEANTNRLKPFQSESETESESEADS
ncbi:PREDICTED: probable RNA-binding protein EIF1AD [Ipomoea nil]|uniref:probable RNA-binding protein EIF1AD n=1 Tax=Ipomoea nil TaxID=35883 RepID=UPI0009014BE3|nr:PREDICTED: probable RNA-binding protein EIF1AD [Ipomoea nil]XP_019163390.1 PREDICTED: probable RNA-binding protein EIF1AD [Ipomoea nil]XP_019163391.1 PREDICTED: probable RNA-binding protein EIF1AD [Ipomoea nil]